MAAVALLGANKVNADTAGFTHVVTESTEQAAQTAHQAENRIAESGGALSDLLGGGLHPEHIVAHASTELEQASNSLATEVGGLRPRAGSVLQSGPAGRAAAAFHHLGL